MFKRGAILASECVICAGALARSRPYSFQSNDFKSIYPEGSVFKCVRCGLFQVNVADIDNDTLTAYYRSSAYRDANIVGNDKGYFSARGAALTALIQQHFEGRPKRIFEVGAGYGFNLVAVKEAFQDAEVLTDEVDEKLRGIRGIRHGNLIDGPFSVVIMSHVLEHFLDPRSVLESALSSLSSGGILVIEVPNDESGESTLTTCDEPHITFFGMKTLSNLLESLPSCELVEVFTAGQRHEQVRRNRKVTKIIGAFSPLLKAARLVQRMIKGGAAGGGPDFTSRTEHGVFLRAVLRKL